MQAVLEVRDKSGRTIHLSKERWAHILMHPEMANKLEQIREALVAPLQIIQFDIDPAVHFYYQYEKSMGCYLLVSVKYLNSHGFVITSFYTDSMRK